MSSPSLGYTGTSINASEHPVQAVNKKTDTNPNFFKLMFRTLEIRVYHLNSFRLNQTHSSLNHLYCY